MKIPDSFQKILELSDKERTFERDRKRDDCGLLSLASILEHPNPFRASLVNAIEVLAEEDLRKLIGWTLFGRDYCEYEGDRISYLLASIHDAGVHGRREGIGYISEKPIGKYLRSARSLLSNIEMLDAKVAQAIYPAESLIDIAVA